MEHKESHIPLIGEKAPEFNACTTQGEIKFPQDYHGKWVVLFSYQSDFSPVCCTELITLGAMSDEFKEINTEIVGLSIDSINSHIAWLRKIKELAWKDMKHIEITFPLIADITMEIADSYGMLQPGFSASQTVRAVFILNPEGIIRAVLYYPEVVGRNIQEIKRLLTAIQKADHEKVATPANWIQNEDVVLLPPKTSKEAAQRLEAAAGDSYCLDWYLCFKPSNCSAGNTDKDPESNPYPSGYPSRYRTGNRR